MTLEQCIETIIKNEFNSGDYFDAHAVIKELVHNKDYFESYLKGFSTRVSVAQYHSEISKIIKSFDNLVVPVEGTSKSHTIFGKIDGITLYRRK